MQQPVDRELLTEIEAHAVDIARRAGAVLDGLFGGSLDVEYKDDKERDPVTRADRESQELLKAAIADRFPDHSILSEEDEEDDSPAEEFVWVLDPLDGTRNFLNGFPVWACSVGVMCRGVPVAGAVFVPWPSDTGGAVLHARKGGGAFVDGSPISVSDAEEPAGNKLVALPAGFGGAYRFGKSMRGKVGELRVTGSIAHELAMTAKGVLQYCVTTGPRLWDVAAGAVLVSEAGGIVMRGRRPRGLRALLGATQWDQTEALVSSWRSGETTMKELRRWSEPLALGGPGVVRYVTANLRRRRRRKRLRLPFRRRPSTSP